MNSSRAKEILGAFRGKNIAVFGDLMLDRYIWGSATRISQEAPVPVVAVNRQSAAPGGAANVLRNLASLGARPSAFGVVGDDPNGAELDALLSDQDVSTTGIQRDPERTTTEKTRIIADHQQVVRIDVEQSDAVGDAQIERVIDHLDTEAVRGSLDAIIIEDYNKGSVTASALNRIVALGHTHSIPVAMDPHPGNPARAAGVSILTPNRAEAFAMSGVYPADSVLPIESDAALLEVVAKLQDEWRAENLLVTLGKDGMALFQNAASPLHIPTRAEEVYDVSGAGDTVIASFVLAFLAGATAEEAAIISNHAAGVVVAKVGTAPVSADELLESFARDE